MSVEMEYLNIGGTDYEVCDHKARVALGRSTETWPGFKTLVDLGLASTAHPVGTQFEDKWSPDGTTEYTCPYDVVHYDSSGNAYVKWHYAIPTGIPFDEPEAIFYAGTGGLAAGSYYITIGTTYGTGWVAGNYISITLNSDMDEGDQLVISCGTNNANDPGGGRAWNVYAAGSTTSKDSGTTGNTATGTSLGTIGDTNAHKTNGLLNAISRVVYGYGRWSQCAVRQWLNSAAAPGGWWAQQNGWDRPPAVAATLRGFMAGISDGLLSVLEKVEVVTALNTQEGFSETSETTEDYFFLPSLQELYVSPQLSGVEGEDWDYYKALAEEAGLTGRFKTGTAYDELKSYQINSTSSAVDVWLRPASRSYAYVAWSVYGSGRVGGSSAYNAFRGCPACKIKKESA